jgi:hypothetical protein
MDKKEKEKPCCELNRKEAEKHKMKLHQYMAHKAKADSLNMNFETYLQTFGVIRHG